MVQRSDCTGPIQRTERMAEVWKGADGEKNGEE